MDRATFIGFILFVMESGIVEDNDDLKATKRATISCDSNKICGCGETTTCLLLTSCCNLA